MKRIIELLKISRPIIQGGMGNISNAALAAAVSNAGGLGTIGCGTLHPDVVEQIILETKNLTEKPFAINIAIGVTDYSKELARLAIKHEVPVVTLSAGNPGPFVPFLQEQGITVMAVVASVKHAKKAEQAGVDILVAEGYEAAGINSNLELTTFTLIPQIVDHVDLPVVAAGGIGDGRGLAAALMLGAEGVQLGTRLIATKEAPFHDTYKQALIRAQGEEAIIVGRSVGRIRRILRNPYAEELMLAEKNGISLPDFNLMTTESQHILGAIQGEMDKGFINGGQVSGLISTVPSVKELFGSMMEEAEKQIKTVSCEWEEMVSE
ncbi:NAD(P)H-dependent flavin oxidoreductase [Bacillus testis]|uniref:NAD(P)H-dependent flavin oxidoreductase n=1 Tax=Bacillus testis TaxID=1622072 RepID=UPI00067F2303|nr:DUF561 domain-containing protein [Bacillus testis]